MPLVEHSKSALLPVSLFHFGSYTWIASVFVLTIVVISMAVRRKNPKSPGKKAEASPTDEEKEALQAFLTALEVQKRADSYILSAVKYSAAILFMSVLIGIALVHGVHRQYISSETIHSLARLLPRSMRPPPPYRVPTSPAAYLDIVTQEGYLDGLRKVSNATWASCGNAVATDALRLGILYLAAFNHPEAQQAFQFCHQADRECPFCFWGLANAEGPFLNVMRHYPPRVKEGDEAPPPPPYPHFSEVRRQNALDYAVRALDLCDEAKWLYEDVRRKVIRATLSRYQAVTKKSKRSPDEEHADDLQRLSDKHPDDVHIAAMAAAARMQLVSWNYLSKNATWTHVVESESELFGKLRAHAKTAAKLLHRALSNRSVVNLLALHLDVHLREMLPPRYIGDAVLEDAYGAASADRLVGLFKSGRMPLGFGHLAHMPSHIYVQIGRYREAVDANVRAHKLDTFSVAVGVNAYLPEHNLHMLVFAASMRGDMTTALKYARDISRLRKKGFASKHLAPGHEAALLPLTLARFGQFDELLALPQPHATEARGFTHRGGAEYALVVWRFARAMALASTTTPVPSDLIASRVEALRAELEALQAAAAAVPVDIDSRPGPKPGIYSGGYKALAEIYVALATAKAGTFGRTFHVDILTQVTGPEADPLRLMEAAVAAGDGLGYLEPPRLLIPLRPCFARLLMHEAAALAEGADSELLAETYAERARALLQEDLEIWRGNYWATQGLKDPGLAEGTRGARVGTKGSGRSRSMCPLMD